MLVQRDLLERLISDRYVEAPDEKAVGVDPQRQSISTDLWSTSAKRLPLHVKDLEGKRVRLQFDSQRNSEIAMGAR